MDKTQTYTQSYPQTIPGYTQMTTADNTTKKRCREKERPVVAIKNTFAHTTRSLFATATSNEEFIHLSTTPITTMTYYIYKKFNGTSVYNTVWICIM